MYFATQQVATYERNDPDMNRAATGLLRLSVAQHATDGPLLRAASRAVERRLYVLLRGDWSPLSLAQATARLQYVYSQAARAEPALDVRVLLPSAGTDSSSAPELEALIGPASEAGALPELNAGRTALGLGALRFLELSDDALKSEGSAKLPAPDAPTPVETEPRPCFDHVCVGGTFDYLHNGHKLLLSMAALACRTRLVVGVSDAPLLKQKVLRELMQPLPLRSALVGDFVRSVSPQLTLELTPLADGYGPAGSDAALEAIAVSAETLKGGDACNAKRAQAQLAPLSVLSIPLVDEPPAGDGGEEEVLGGGGGAVSAEDKLSSTDRRKARLATLRRGDETTWARVSAADAPYVVGLTGGISSGKSTAARSLQARGVPTLDCDRLAHEAYAPGTAAFGALVAAFGDGIVGDDGAVNRRALGAKVFSDKAAMDTLCQIVWPATAALAAARIAEAGAPVVVMEAAVLLEAGWEAMCDETWCVTAPHKLTLERLTARDSIGEADAERKIAAQMGTDARAARCDLVVSSAWGEAALLEQVARALAGAERRATLQLPPPADEGSAAARASLQARWGAACAGANVAAPLQRKWWRRLRDLHCDNVRWYHTLTHLGEVFGRLDRVRASLAAPRLAAFTVFFHDAIYEPTAKDNEERSAQLWRSFAAEAALPPADVEPVAAWIEHSKSHLKANATGDLAHFLDADIAVLGKPPAAYAEYARQVRLEYCHVGEAAFPGARAAAMKTFATAERLYFTDQAQAELGEQARNNLTSEVERLSALAAAAR